MSTKTTEKEPTLQEWLDSLSDERLAELERPLKSFKSTGLYSMFNKK